MAIIASFNSKDLSLDQSANTHIQEIRCAAVNIDGEALQMTSITHVTFQSTDSADPYRYHALYMMLMLAVWVALGEPILHDFQHQNMVFQHEIWRSSPASRGRTFLIGAASPSFVVPRLGALRYSVSTTWYLASKHGTHTGYLSDWTIRPQITSPYRFTTLFQTTLGLTSFVSLELAGQCQAEIRYNIVQIAPWWTANWLDGLI